MIPIPFAINLRIYQKLKFLRPNKILEKKNN